MQHSSYHSETYGRPTTVLSNGLSSEIVTYSAETIEEEQAEIAAQKALQARDIAFLAVGVLYHQPVSVILLNFYLFSIVNVTNSFCICGTDPGCGRRGSGLVPDHLR